MKCNCIASLMSLSLLLLCGCEDSEAERGATEFAADATVDEDGMQFGGEDGAGLFFPEVDPGSGGGSESIVSDGTCIDASDCPDVTSSPCQSVMCLEGVCALDYGEGNPCDDQDTCTDNDLCVGGECVGEPSCQCVADAECDDGNECTFDICSKSGVCESSPLEDVACEDGDPCTQGDVCGGGECVPGLAVDCTCPELEIALNDEGGYCSINKAVADAEPGDTITLGAQTYEEWVVLDRSLTLRGSSGGQTILTGSDGTLLSITAGEVVLDGLVFTGGTQAIEMSGESLVIQDALLSDYAQTGLYVVQGDAHLESTVLDGKYGSDNVGIYGNAEQATISVIGGMVRNHGGIGIATFGSSLALDDALQVRNNEAGGVRVDGGLVSIGDCMVTENGLFGVYGIEAEMELSYTIIQKTKGEPAYGVWGDKAVLTASDVTVTENEGTGLYLTDSSAVLSSSDTDGQDLEVSSNEGDGFCSLGGSAVAISGGTFSDNVEANVRVESGLVTLAGLESSNAVSSSKGDGVVVVLVESGSVIQGIRSQYNGHDGIRVEMSSVEIWESVGVRYNQGAGIRVTNSPSVLVKDNALVNNNEGGGIVFEGASGTISGNLVFESLAQGLEAGDGIRVSSSSGVEIHNNTITGCEGTGIRLLESNGVLLTLNSIQSCQMAGVWVSDVVGVQATSNTVENNFSYGFRVTDSYGDLENNDVSGTLESDDGPGYGVSWIGANEISTDNKFSENTSSYNAGHGVFLEDFSGDVTETVAIANEMAGLVMAGEFSGACTNNLTTENGLHGMVCSATSFVEPTPCTLNISLGNSGLDGVNCQESCFISNP